MYIDVSQRFTQVVKYLIDSRTIKNQAELTQILSLSKGYVSQLVNGQREPSGEVVSKLANHFPIINEGWILTGNGNMLISSEDQPENPVEEKPETVSQIDKLIAIVDEQRVLISQLFQAMKEKDEKILELLDELLIYKQHKGETARNAGDSSSANVG